MVGTDDLEEKNTAGQKLNCQKIYGMVGTEVYEEKYTTGQKINCQKLYGMVGTEFLEEKYTAGQKLNCQKIIRNGRDGGFGRKVHGRSKVKLSKHYTEW